MTIDQIISVTAIVVPLGTTGVVAYTKLSNDIATLKTLVRNGILETLKSVSESNGELRERVAVIEAEIDLGRERE